MFSALPAFLLRVAGSFATRGRRCGELVVFGKDGGTVVFGSGSLRLGGVL